VTLNQNGAVPAKDGDLMFASGFGFTGTGSGVSNVLMGTTIPYTADCSDTVKNFENNRMVCGNSKVTATCGGGMFLHTDTAYFLMTPITDRENLS
jgi:hypothetical protein